MFSMRSSHRSFRTEQADSSSFTFAPANVSACAERNLSAGFPCLYSHRFLRHLSTGAFSFFRADFKSRRHARASSSLKCVFDSASAKPHAVQIFGFLSFIFSLPLCGESPSSFLSGFLPVLRPRTSLSGYNPLRSTTHAPKRNHLLRSRVSRRRLRSALARLFHFHAS